MSTTRVPEAGRAATPTVRITRSFDVCGSAASCVALPVLVGVLVAVSVSAGVYLVAFAALPTDTVDVPRETLVVSSTPANEYPAGRSASTTVSPLACEARLTVARKRRTRASYACTADAL